MAIPLCLELFADYASIKIFRKVEVYRGEIGQGKGEGGKNGTELNCNALGSFLSEILTKIGLELEIFCRILCASLKNSSSNMKNFVEMMTM